MSSPTATGTSVRPSRYRSLHASLARCAVSASVTVTPTKSKVGLFNAYPSAHPSSISVPISVSRQPSLRVCCARPRLRREQTAQNREGYASEAAELVESISRISDQ